MPCDFWAVSQETGADFVMGPGLLDGFRRVLSAIGFVDLGKRWRRAAFRVGSACETVQKSQMGLASGKGGAANAAKRAGFAGRKGWGGCQGACLARGSHEREQT